MLPPALTWSADAGEILLAANRRADWDMAPNEIDVYAVRVADGAVRRLTEISGPTAHPVRRRRRDRVHGVNERGLSNQLRRLHVMQAAGGAPREFLPGFDRSVGEIAWSATEKRCSSPDHDAGRRVPIARASLDGGMTMLVSDARFRADRDALLAGGGVFGCTRRKP